MEPHCGNCGKGGHVFHQCKMPIMSLGIVAFMTDLSGNNRFLMIRRKDTLGFMDFMRGKYSIYNKDYLVNLLNEMTLSEKRDIVEKDFDVLWKKIWCNHSGQYKSEEDASREKFYALRDGIMTQTEMYTLTDLIQASTTVWEEAEWGFPKGRRNMYEKDVDCALREFTEETGYDIGDLIENIQPFEEIFMGSNYKSYKHKYYLMKMEEEVEQIASYDKSEVSKIEWKTYEECLSSIRPYNLEKKRVIMDIYQCLRFCELFA
jgi:8-oxo-dGTP pyrophosphatase MutT (NUDIX family)